MGAENSKGEQPKRLEYCPWRGRPQVQTFAPPQPGFYQPAMRLSRRACSAASSSGVALPPACTLSVSPA